MEDEEERPSGDPEADSEEASDSEPVERADEGETPAEEPRVRQVDRKHLGNFRWLEIAGEALAVILRGGSVKTDRMDVGSAGGFLTHLDTLTRLLAARFAGETLKATGTIKRPGGVGRLQLAEAAGGNSITLHFAVDQPSQMKMDGGDDLWDSPMGRAIREVVSLIEMSENVDGLLDESRMLGDRIADRYHDLLDFLVNEELEAEWHPRDRSGVVLTTRGAAEVKAALDQEVAEEVDTTTFTGVLYEANARTQGFELETSGAERIQGSYPEELTEYIRFAWDRRVEATIRVVEHRRARSSTPFKREYRLLDVSLPDEQGPQLFRGPATEA